MLEVLKYPNPILRKKSKNVEMIDKKLKQLVNEMIETMYAENGIGLAAPQIGENIRLIVMDTDVDGEEQKPIVMINPIIKKRSSEKLTEEEGCLSVPKLRCQMVRSECVTVEYQDLEGNIIELEANGITARCIQHELDHLDGVLFIDKLLPATKISIKQDLDARVEEWKLLNRNNDKQ